MTAITPDGRDAPSPRERLATALRPVITMTVASELTDEALTEAAEAIEAMAARLGSQAGPRRPRRPLQLSQAAQEYFPTSPIIGGENPIAPPVTVWTVDGADGGYREIRGTAWFDYPYEGPPTCVHGGVIAETFDELLGTANVAAENPGKTGTLTVRYRRPTPLRTDLRLEARCTGRDGRKISTWAGIYHGDVLTAEADGIFIEVAPARFLALAEGHAANVDPATLADMRTEATRLAGEQGDTTPS